MSTMSMINDLKKLDITQFANVTQTTFATLDNYPPLSLHNWLKIPKGTIVGLIDDISDNDLNDPFSTHMKIRAYASHGNAYILVTLPYERIKLIKN